MYTGGVLAHDTRKLKTECETEWIDAVLRIVSSTYPLPKRCRVFLILGGRRATAVAVVGHMCIFTSYGRDVVRSSAKQHRRWSRWFRQELQAPNMQYARHAD